MLSLVFGEVGEQNPLGREASNKAARFRSPKLAIKIYLGFKDVKSTSRIGMHYLISITTGFVIGSTNEQAHGVQSSVGTGQHIQKALSPRARYDLLTCLRQP